MKMFEMKGHLLALAAVLLAIDLSTASEAHWGYPDLDGDAVEFPRWGGICDSGTLQSPINLNIQSSLKGVFGDLVFKNYNDHQPQVQMVNNGHTIQLSGFTHPMELQGGPLNDDYITEQIHLHWWSEHTINSIRYPLEVHIVHRNKRYDNMTEAAKYKDGITVVGVLYHVSNEPNDAIERIIQKLDDVKSYTQLNKPVRVPPPFVVRDLFPVIDGYFTYAGSLTTPTCDESVTWIVLRETFPVTLQQVDKFKEIEIDQGKVLKNNYRFIQKTNNRPVVVVLYEEEDFGNAANSLRISMGIALVAIVVKFLH